ncbi:MAG: LLM class flavin-dependent oxidoreductase [Myxococcota bacterium]
MLRRLWRERVVDYRGEHHRIDRAGLLPLPGREIPIWLGGFVPAAYARAARIGDGFLYGGDAKVAAKALGQHASSSPRPGATSRASARS